MGGGNGWLPTTPRTGFSGLNFKSELTNRSDLKGDVVVQFGVPPLRRYVETRSRPGACLLLRLSRTVFDCLHTCRIAP
jgi:hypothetical protein